MNITEAYREQNRLLHEQNASYGISGAKWREFARTLSDWGRKAILDYGCGKCTLAQSLGPAYRVTNYDPAIPEYAQEPQPHDIVICGDVMEHVEPECVDSVLKDIRRLTKQKALFVIALAPSGKTLPDGRNTHISINPPEWWRERLKEAGFAIEKQKEMQPQEGTTWFIVH